MNSEESSTSPTSGQIDQAIKYAHDVGFDEGYECGYEDGYNDATSGVTCKEEE